MSAAWAALAALGERVLVAALLAAVLGGLVALLLRGLPSTPPALRAWIWWLVAARSLAELAGAPPVELAWLPARAPWVASGAAPRAVVLDVDPGAAPWTPAPPPVAARTGSARASAVPVPWRALLGAAWAILAAAALARSARELVLIRRRLARAPLVEDPASLAVLRRVAAALGPGRRARLALSDEIDVPQVAGFWRATVLLPRAAALTGEELEMTLAHELAHVRRLEGVVALVPFFAERLFVWHPLVRLAAREYAIASEQACDALVFARLHPAPERYGRLLLRFALHTPPARAAAAWPLARRPLERRLEMLERTLRGRRPSAGVLALGALLVVAVATPLRLIAAPSERPPAPPVVAVPATAPPAPPPVSPVTPVPPAPVPAAPQPLVLPPTAPLLPAPPTPATAPAPPLVPPAPFALPDLEGLSLVLVEGDRTLALNASAADQALARRLCREDGQPALVFHRAGEPRRVVRDRATIDAVRAVVDEQVRMAREQAGLARRQAELAGRAAGEAARQAAEQARAAAAAARAFSTHERTRAELAAEMAVLEARLAELRHQLETGAFRDLERREGNRGEVERDRQQLERDAERLREQAERVRDEAGRRILEILESAPAAPPQR